MFKQKSHFLVFSQGSVMQPLRKYQTISCCPEPLTSVRRGRVYGNRTERKAEHLVTRRKLLLQANPRGTGMIVDSNGVSAHTKGLALRRWGVTRRTTAHPWCSKMTSRQHRTSRQGNSKVDPDHSVTQA